MKNPFPSLLRSVLRYFRPTHRAQPEQSLSPEQLRKALTEMLADPETRTLLMRNLVGTVFPIQGGVCAVLAKDVGPGEFGSDPSCGGGDYTFPAKVGIGTTTPGALLDIVATGTDPASVRLLEPSTGVAGLFQAETARALVGTASAHDLKIITGLTDRIIISGTTGNVGIGTTPNVHRLVSRLNPTGGEFQFLGNSPDGPFIGLLADAGEPGGFWNPMVSPLDNALIFSAGAQDTGALVIGPWSPTAKAIKIDSTGNVGIGTTPAEKLDVAGNGKADGLIGPPRMMFANALFSLAAGEDIGSATFSASDGCMEAQTGTTANSHDETVGGIITRNDLTQTENLTTGLNQPGAFVSARARWNSAIQSSHQFYILAGGVSGGAFLQSGFGFKAVGSALKGVTMVNGIQTVVDLATTLASGAFVELFAVRRASSIEFYVNGVLKGSSSSNLPSSAASTYEVRSENGASGTNAVLQVGYLTVGLPI